MPKVKSSTVKTRTRTAAAIKPKPEVEEDDDVVVETSEDDDEDPGVFSAAEAEPEAEAEPARDVAPQTRRGRPKGSRKPKAAPEASDDEDLFSALCATGFTIKRLAASHGKTPGQILNAIEQIVQASTNLETSLVE
jgi:hypothetical protein